MSAFERILTFDDYHLVTGQGGLERESWLASKSSESPRTPLQDEEEFDLISIDNLPRRALEDKHESRWRNRLPRDNLSNVQLQTFRRRALAMTVLAKRVLPL